MLLNILDNLRLNASNDDFDSRRQYQRRTMDNCIGIIDGKAYPIRDWSQGGVQLIGAEDEFNVNDIKTITLKFKLSERIIDVEHTGRILRKGRNKFALQFSPLTSDVDRKFRQVVEDCVTRDFANSQL